ncbi:hypothetical protein PIB30_060550 [Stylosanthes scabra]|uniref:Uncharacterized protein n=1 Tax=Stylosanthes scabra TaxID=79078 RepID=A0ABU6RLP5_9FABA|nr:hypothetical protein [Stylosanthes scabra]
MYSEIPADVKKQKFTWPEEEKEQIKKAYDYQAGRRYRQIMSDVRDGQLQRLMWLSETLRKQLLDMFATEPDFLKCQAVNKVHQTSSTGGCLHIGVFATIPKTCARMTRSLDCPPTEPELFRRPTHRSVTDPLWRSAPMTCWDALTEFSAIFELATQKVHEEGDESAGTVDPNGLWRQALSEPYKNWVYGAGGFFAPPAMEVPLPIPPALRQALLRRLRL